MPNQDQEFKKKLQAPFDEKFKRKNRDGRIIYLDAAYEQRLDDVFGFGWQLHRDGSLYRLTINIPPFGQVTRVGESFREACGKFGIGRYLQE